LAVEILDIEGVVLAESRKVAEDGVRQPCVWKEMEDLEGMAEQTVQLRFRLAGAALYAFWCE
jgi:hypothetical protein